MLDTLAVVCLLSQPLLPSPFTLDDAGQLLQGCLKAAGRSSARVFCESIVVSEQFLQNCKDPFQQLMQEKAKAVSLFFKPTRINPAQPGSLERTKLRMNRPARHWSSCKISFVPHRGRNANCLAGITYDL